MTRRDFISKLAGMAAVGALAPAVVAAIPKPVVPFAGIDRITDADNGLYIIDAKFIVDVEGGAWEIDIPNVTWDFLSLIIEKHHPELAVEMKGIAA